MATQLEEEAYRRPQSQSRVQSRGPGEGPRHQPNSKSYAEELQVVLVMKSFCDAVQDQIRAKKQRDQNSKQERERWEQKKDQEIAVGLPILELSSAHRVRTIILGVKAELGHLSPEMAMCKLHG